MARQMPESAASPWEGAGAEAAQLCASTDLIKVRELADTLRSASTVADNGADEIYAARRSVLYAVADAESTWFAVGEDLSLISGQTGDRPPYGLRGRHKPKHLPRTSAPRQPH